MLQDLMKNAILMAHGVGPFRVQIVAKRLKHRRINAMHLVYKIKPDSSGLVRAIQFGAPQKWITRTSRV